MKILLWTWHIALSLLAWATLFYMLFFFDIWIRDLDPFHVALIVALVLPFAAFGQHTNPKKKAKLLAISTAIYALIFGYVLILK